MNYVLMILHIISKWRGSSQWRNSTRFKSRFLVNRLRDVGSSGRSGGSERVV